MCLTVLLGDLGPAQAGLDVSRRTMVISPGLAMPDRVFAARWMLTRAGQLQPLDEPEQVICLCGLPLDLGIAATVQGEPELMEASTGNIPAVLDELNRLLLA